MPGGRPTGGSLVARHGSDAGKLGGRPLAAAPGGGPRFQVEETACTTPGDCCFHALFAMGASCSTVRPLPISVVGQADVKKVFPELSPVLVVVGGEQGGGGVLRRDGSHGASALPGCALRALAVHALARVGL